MIKEIVSSSGNTVTADVCIVGAGPAGIVLALTLAEKGVSSVLLEAGSLEPPGRSGLEMYQGEVVGLPYPFEASRLRYFGGTSNHWGGWCRPLDEVDFTRRPDAPLPSWPISRESLHSHYQKALKWCEIDSSNFDAGSSVTVPELDLLFRKESGFTSRLFRFSPPTRFGKVYLRKIKKSRLVKCYLDATLVEVSQSGGVINTGTVRSSGGDTLKISADRFVLAMGGIENARFLMNTATDPKKALGNQSGLLGACFMDHFGFHPGYLTAPSTLKHFRHDVDGKAVLPIITLDQEMQVAQNLPSICAICTPDSPSQEVPFGYFSNPGIVGVNAENYLRYRVQLICEPTAHHKSTVALSEDRDAFGLRKAKLDWNIPDQDYRDVERFVTYFARAVGASGKGRLQRTRKFEGEIRRNLTGGMHHMGTTRMASSDSGGVVDTDCRVFGTDNLYIAGSSVFPRVGFSNPTLTIVALVDRLAGHLSGNH